MQYKIKDKKLQPLEKEGGYKKYPPEMGRLFRKCLNLIEAVGNVNDLKQMRSLKFESYKERSEYSVRLNDQYRLMFLIEDDVIIICSIEDYH